MASRRSSALVSALALGLCLCSTASGAGDHQVGPPEEAPFLPVRADRLRLLAERTAREVVQVEVEKAGAEGDLVPPPRFEGGGFHVGEGRVLTSAFLVRDVAHVRVRLPDGRPVGARVARVGARAGLALLHCEEARPLPVPEIAPVPAPAIGATLYLQSRPATAAPALAVGYWIEPPGAAFYGRASLPARNGHPLYDVHGRVSGVALLPAKAGLGSLVVPAWAIRKFLGLPAAPPPSRD